MSIIKKIATGALVNWSASKGGYKSQSGSFVMPDETYRFRVILEPIGDYWAVWEGGGSCEFYRSTTNYIYKSSPTRKTDIAFNPIRMRFPTTTTSVTYIDSSALTSTYLMFGSCRSLTSVPLFDTRNVEDMGSIFYNCTSLASVPAFDTRNVTNMGQMFDRCYSLASVPAFDTRNVTNMYYMFSSCTSLTSIPAFNTSNVTSMRSMFAGCSALTSVPAFNTSNVTSMDSMFQACTALKTIPLLNMSNVTDTNTGWMFWDCIALENITLEGSLNDSVYFSSCTKLTYDSILSILTAAANTRNLNSKTLYFNRTIEDRDDELDALVASCVSKNWTITGLTLV